MCVCVCVHMSCSFRRCSSHGLRLMLGMEIREQVTNYVGKRIQAMRQGAEGTPSHHNVSASWQRIRPCYAG